MAMQGVSGVVAYHVRQASSAARGNGAAKYGLDLVMKTISIHLGQGLSERERIDAVRRPASARAPEIDMAASMSVMDGGPFEAAMGRGGAVAPTLAIAPRHRRCPAAS